MYEQQKKSSGVALENKMDGGLLQVRFDFVPGAAALDDHLDDPCAVGDASHARTSSQGALPCIAGLKTLGRSSRPL